MTDNQDDKSGQSSCRGMSLEEMEEVVRRGSALYEQLRPEMERNHHGQFLTIAVETGEYVLAGDGVAIQHMFRDRFGESARGYTVRIGMPAMTGLAVLDE